jgi:hypothetical protein
MRLEFWRRNDGPDMPGKFAGHGSAGVLAKKEGFA